MNGSAFSVGKEAEGLVLLVSANRDQLDQVGYAVKSMELLEKESGIKIM